MTLYTEIYGHGEPLVLVHGWAMHTGIWRHFAQQLEQRYQVICIDLPGHGRSAARPFTLPHIRDALQGVVPDQACHWLGWSLGASIVLDIAAHAPERVKTISIVAGNPCFTGCDDWPGVAMAVLENFAAHLDEDCRTTLARFLALQVHGMENSRELLKNLKQAVLECPPPDPVTLYGGLEILKHADFRPVLEILSCPLNVILGTRDTFVPVAIGDAILHLKPDAKICCIDKAGHVPFISHEVQVVEKIFEFMEQSA